MQIEKIKNNLDLDVCRTSPVITVIPVVAIMFYISCADQLISDISSDADVVSAATSLSAP